MLLQEKKARTSSVLNEEVAVGGAMLSESNFDTLELPDDINLEPRVRVLVC